MRLFCSAPNSCDGKICPSHGYFEIMILEIVGGREAVCPLALNYSGMIYEVEGGIGMLGRALGLEGILEINY